MSNSATTYLVIAADEVVHRTDDRKKAEGFAECYGEHVGEACEIAELCESATSPRPESKGGES